MIFKLDDKFIEKYKTIKPDFGFNGLGEITYIRTYSRLKEDGTNEQWYETIRRVVEGCYSMQKQHIIDNKLGWNDERAQESAQEMYDRAFTMKFLPPGRSLWIQGTSAVTEKGLYAALQNCAFVSTEDINKKLTRPFEFMMDMSMLGVGIGFDTKGANKITIHEPSKELTYIFPIPDTREGWVESLRHLLLSYFLPDKITVSFDYTQIRVAGLPIKTFGGLSSGPEPLVELHDSIRQIFVNRDNTPITSRDIVDIMNLIGKCVVAGNVRRTAQLVLGDANDDDYLKLKDYRWNNSTQQFEGSAIDRASFGWTSNNSVSCTVGQDYTKLAQQTMQNGEPGYVWLENMQDYSRMCDPKDYKDSKALGCNPCAEQTLESYEMCCLVEVFPTRCTDLEDFKRTLKFAYLYGKTITLSKTHWTETNRVMLRNRRIGTSVSGIAQFISNHGLNELKTWLNEGYKTIQRYDDVYSDWLAIPKSIKTTSIKPSGSISLLAGVTPGVHYPESNIYIRRIRIANNSKLLASLSDAGYCIEQDVNDSSVSVVEVPIKLDNVRSLNEVSIWEQVSLAAFMQENWADNQVSCTVTFKQDEAKDIPNVLDYFQYKLKAISFLPKLEKGVFPQMPYEGVSEEVYVEKSKNIKPINFINISEDSKPELFCTNDTCEIKKK